MRGQNKMGPPAIGAIAAGMARRRIHTPNDEKKKEVVVCEYDETLGERVNLALQSHSKTGDFLVDSIVAAIRKRERYELLSILTKIPAVPHLFAYLVAGYFLIMLPLAVLAYKYHVEDIAGELFAVDIIERLSSLQIVGWWLLALFVFSSFLLILKRALDLDDKANPKLRKDVNDDLGVKEYATVISVLQEYNVTFPWEQWE